MYKFHLNHCFLWRSF